MTCPPTAATPLEAQLCFQRNKIDNKMTINGARGFHPRIADRFGLTLECIRRHYLGELPNPLGDVINRYADFFALFENFAGYVKFFLLKDLVEEDGKTVRFFHRFEDFRTPAVPKTKDEYLEYLRAEKASSPLVAAQSTPNTRTLPKPTFA